MTTTASISGQSIGTSTNVGNGKFPQKVTAAVTTTGFVISARVTMGTQGSAGASTVRVWYSSSSFNITAAAAVEALSGTVRYLDLILPTTGGTVRIKDGTLEPMTGGYIHIWCDVPVLDVAATLDVNVVELP